MLDISKIYSSKSYGDFKVVNYKNSHHVEVQFLETGYKCIVQAGNVTSGGVKDKLFPSVCGVGFVGEGKFKAKVNGAVSQQYNTWRNMLERCYSPKYHKTRPTYIGCSVCEEWHNFQNFVEWFNYNYIEGFDIDKDIKQKGVKGKVYSPETCIFVSRKDNAVEATARSFKVLDPNKAIHEVYNMSEFCRKNGLKQSKMSLVCSGKRGHHKGWIKA